MNILVNGRHLEITPALKSYAEEKIKKFEKYSSDIAEAIVTLSVEKYRHKAEVLLKANGLLIQAESVTGEIYSAIDEVSENSTARSRNTKRSLYRTERVLPGAPKPRLSPLPCTREAES